MFQLGFTHYKSIIIIPVDLMPWFTSHVLFGVMMTWGKLFESVEAARQAIIDEKFVCERVLVATAENVLEQV